jgi:hypothetical protein
VDKDKAAKNIRAVMDKILGDTDLVQLSQYKKIYKKEISIFKRSWAAAWLFMYYDQRENPRFNAAEKSSNNEKYSEKKTDTQPDIEVNLAEEESKRLFISIGKNRRLYPRELIAFIISKTSAVREDIGSIRILDNYSFVQVRDNKADEIIAALNGVKFRGRTLTVNFAKPKNSDTDTSESAQQE